MCLNNVHHAQQLISKSKGSICKKQGVPTCVPDIKKEKKKVSSRTRGLGFEDMPFVHSSPHINFRQHAKARETSLRYHRL